MPHAPFIIASYMIAAILLGWCAIAPVINSKKLKQQILKRQQNLNMKNMENDHASHS
jgi:heme exporter protein CcmD